MQNLLEKTLTKEDIISYYSKGESDKKLIGLEYERISLDKKTFFQADFKKLFKIFEDFSKLNDFELIYDKNTIIGAKNSENTSLSLEPGGQFEISLNPKKSLYEIQFLMNNYLNQIDNLGDIYGVKFLPMGSNPKVCYQNMKILDKRRYLLMADYLPKIGKFAPVMMKETAGIQVNIDYKNEADCKRKLRASAFISPFLTGFFANSPFRNNKLTNYKSIRALAWKYTGYNRCNLFYKGVIDNDSPLYEQYMDYILDVPMIFIERMGEYIPIMGKINFRQFMENGYMDHFATLEDYLLHQSLCFPDIRLKNCLEIRNHDSNNLEIAIGIGAIYKGILYNNSNTDKILKYFEGLNSSDLHFFGFLASRFGVNFEVEKLNKMAYEIVTDILEIAKEGLIDDEKKYLNWLIQLAKSKRCMADLILENICNEKEA